MQGTGHTIPAVWVFRAGVASALHDVNLAAGRPRTIGALPVWSLRFWHHPDRRPQPVSSGKLGHDLHTPVGNGLLALSVQTSALDWVDDCARCHVAPNGTVTLVARDRGTGSCRGEVQHVPVIDLCRCNVCAIGGEGGDNMQTLRVDIRVF